MPPDHYAYEAIEWAAEVGVTTGYTDGTFKPERPLNKRHAVVFIERYYYQILQASQSEDFTRGDMMVLLKAINDGSLRDVALVAAGTPVTAIAQSHRFPDVPTGPATYRTLRPHIHTDRSPCRASGQMLASRDIILLTATSASTTSLELL